MKLEVNLKTNLTLTKWKRSNKIQHFSVIVVVACVCVCVEIKSLLKYAFNIMKYRKEPMKKQKNQEEMCNDLYPSELLTPYENLSSIILNKYITSPHKIPYCMFKQLYTSKMPPSVGGDKLGTLETLVKV